MTTVVRVAQVSKTVRVVAGATTVRVTSPAVWRLAGVETVGPAGPTGPTGATGPAGPAGATGGGGASNITAQATQPAGMVTGQMWIQTGIPEPILWVKA